LGFSDEEFEKLEAAGHIRNRYDDEVIENG
jgi:hypothetical protein